MNSTHSSRTRFTKVSKPLRTPSTAPRGAPRQRRRHDARSSPRAACEALTAMGGGARWVRLTLSSPGELDSHALINVLAQIKHSALLLPRLLAHRMSWAVASGSSG
jgi:hypothetical protein